MQLLDNYLKAVGKGLPASQREDILRELSDDIRAEMEEKEVELRRRLTSDEQQAILKQRGNPLLLAARYRQDTRALVIGRELIGPALFPFYTKVLSFNLGLTFIIITIIFSALVTTGQHVGFQDILSTALLQLFIQLSAVTLIFWMIQRHMTKFPERWNLGAPRGLHLDVRIEGDLFGRRKDSARVSRFDSIVAVVASAVGLVWLKEVQLHPFLVFGPAAYFLKLAPVWNQAIPMIVFLVCLEMARATVAFIRPDWLRFHAAARVVSTSVHLAITVFLLRAGAWVAVAGTPGSEKFAEATGIVNQVFLYGLLTGAIIAAVQLVRRIAQLLREERKVASSSADAVC